MRRVGLLLVFGVLMLAFPTLVPPAEASHKTPPVPVLEWVSCGPEFPGTECTTATVPLDYDRPNGASTQLALGRVPASDQANRIGTVFVHFGGPSSGLEWLLDLGFGHIISQQLQGRFDVVGFDQRGIGASEPLRCFATNEEQAAFFVPPFFPHQADQYLPYYQHRRQLADECLDDDQAIARHMSTADVARDLDLLRQAVGDPQLTYLGFSYGSYLGTTYANLFPRNIRALAIDGVLDPRLWSKGRSSATAGPALQELLDEFLRLCDEAGPDQCAFTTPDGSSARWDALSATLLAAPFELDDGTTLTYDLLVAVTGILLDEPETAWAGPDGLAALLDGLADAVLDIPTTATAGPAIQGPLAQRLTAVEQTQDDYNNFPDAVYGNRCADTRFPSSFGGFRSFDRKLAAESQFGPWLWWDFSACTDWPVSKDRHAGPWRARTSAPVLVVGNLYDGNTPYTGAQATTRLLRNSRLLTYAGWGHVAYPRSQCTVDHVTAYLLDLTLPPDGTICPANPNPFLIPTEVQAPLSSAVGQSTASPTG